MPKFLDAPSWYDETGTLRTLSGTVRFNSLAGFVDLPYTTFASGGARSSYYVLTSAGTNGNIAYSNGSYPMWLSNGTSGQVLTSNGTGAAPSWRSTSLFLHNFYLNSDSGSAKEDYKRICFTVVCSKEEPITSAPSLCSFMTSMGLTTYPATGIYTNKSVIQVLFSYTSSSNWRISSISGEWASNLFMSNSFPDGEIQDNVIAISLISN